MATSFLLKGLILGFAIAAPVGPIGLLCIQRTVQFGRLSGLFSGLGAAFADMIYGIIAAFGLTLISEFLFAHQFWLRVVGGAFLIILGIRTMLAKSHVKDNRVTHKTLITDFVSTFFLTMTNPLTILSYLAIFAGLGLADMRGNYFHAAWLVFGVFLGSALWWLILSEGVTLFREKVSQKVMTWINLIAGAMIAIFGLIAWISLT